MEHAFVLCSQNIITFDHLAPDFMSATGIEHCPPDETSAVDSHAILEAPDKTAWNKAKSGPFTGYSSRDPLPENQKIQPHRRYPPMLKCCM
jgi:hypothetical protein